MKNVSFMQLVLGISGALLIYSGIKDVDLPGFLHELVINPKQAFNQGWLNAKGIPAPPPGSGSQPASNTTPSTPSNTARVGSAANPWNA